MTLLKKFELIKLEKIAIALCPSTLTVQPALGQEADTPVINGERRSCHFEFNEESGLGLSLPYQ